MKRPHVSILERLNSMQLAVSNTFGDPRIKELVGSFGYTDEKLNEGKDLYTNALMTSNIQTASGGTQKDSTAKVIRAEKTAHAAYQDLAKVARAIFKNDKPKLKMLGLEGKMPTRIGEFLGTAYTLFNNAASVEELKKEFSKYGYNEKKLAAEKLALERQVQDQQFKNIEMYKAAMEVLGRYEKFGLGDAILAREPFTAAQRVKFQSLVQDFADQLTDARISPEKK